MLDRLASDSLVAWYGRLLAREAWARDALAPYAGRTARIEAGLVTVFLAVQPGGTLAVGSGDPSVTITLEPQALASSVFDPGAFQRKMKIDGDAQFAQALTDVLARLRPDPAEELSRFFGDAPAERMVGAMNAAVAQVKETAQRMARQGADYFVSENPLLVGRAEWNAFAQEVKALQERVARVEATAGSLPRGL